ncbi:polysaccharide deacetylase family protein [uncultured Sunxiuqinia sp.]|uniref:polysaccharide deacetylase family protein n=1 Tax=uncultured Sunxiuqinia sp. TaxID=1573825 RepID=UPI002623F9D5|nr:polysaccharide deacetylase family protein [uncultured Sunxiuqinia sp.]
MLVVFAQEITNRLQYTFDFIFSEILGVPFLLTTDLHEFNESQFPKINYSLLPLDCPLQMHPHPILFQHTINFHSLEAVPYKDEVYFFESSGDSFLPFDPFAASFYLLSRYEEYLMRELDEHHRYPSHHSVLYRNHLLDKPVVNQWAQLIAHEIKMHYPGFDYEKPRFDFLSTIDIDNAWAYKNKGWWRTAGAFVRGLLKGEKHLLEERMQVLRGELDDPYDTYDYIRELYGERKELLRFFILLGKTSQYDRNVSPDNEELQKLIKELSANFQLGIHPSYRSTKRKKELRQEIRTLETITQQKVEASRQHFLRLVLPTTYRRLIKAGIQHDYTMGYADQCGFRAGTSSSFWFYDLKKEEQTTLRIHPFQLMDVTLKNYLKLAPDEALEVIGKLMQEIREYGGTFICLWHNESLSDRGEWKGWRTVFEQMTEQAIKYKDESGTN